jgi:methanol--5-hydroxybenzimidazolylcobamide Co-methyltransferase
MDKNFEKLIFTDKNDLIFGRAKYPVVCGFGVEIGAGRVIPEVNFTLPPMNINEESISEVRDRFRQMVRRILEKAVELEQEEIVLELEHLFELTKNPQWGAMVTSDIKKIMDEFYNHYGLKSALRVTIADIRDQERPPKMRSGKLVETMFESFEKCAMEGADILSIESTGGKEVHDQALLTGNIRGMIFALGVLGVKDMEFLWKNIVEIANKYKVIPGGDTACGFANTAMQLSHQKLLPKVLSAVDRLITIPRSLKAVEMGAKGPLKDCGYENPAIKLITGVPISMEGKSSACAHSSPLGNISAYACDLWSNESVQDVRLLSGFAPEVFTEILIYDCRLMNTALKKGFGKELRDLFIYSDIYLDPQAYVLSLDVLYNSAKKIVEIGDYYKSTVEVGRYAVECIKEFLRNSKVKISPREEQWLLKIEEELNSIPDDPQNLLEEILEDEGDLFIKEEYGL